MKFYPQYHHTLAEWAALKNVLTCGLVAYRYALWINKTPFDRRPFELECKWQIKRISRFNLLKVSVWAFILHPHLQVYETSALIKGTVSVYEVLRQYIISSRDVTLCNGGIEVIEISDTNRCIDNHFDRVFVDNAEYSKDRTDHYEHIMRRLRKVRGWPYAMLCELRARLIIWYRGKARHEKPWCDPAYLRRHGL